MIHKIHAAHLVITGSTDSINIQGRLINNGNKAAHTHAAEHVMMLHSCLKHLHKKSVHLVKTQNKERTVCKDDKMPDHHHIAQRKQLPACQNAFHGMQEWESVEVATGKALSHVHAPSWQWPLCRRISQLAG